MAVNIPQVITPDSASGALVVDGGLRFNKSKNNYLTKTLGTAGNRKTWTWSGWLKAIDTEATMHIFAAGTASTDRLSLYISASSPTGRIKLSERISNSATDILASTKLHRDPFGWYHIVLRWDTTNSTADDRVRLYVNGEQITDFDIRNNPSLNHQSFVNNNIEHTLGYNLTSTYLNGIQSQCYFIDGQALGPEHFGFTDPLTNTWRPKKFDIRSENNSNDGTTWNSTYSAAFLGNAMTDSALVGSYSSLNSSITITLSSSVQVESSLKLNLYASVANFTNYATISINGTDQTSNMTLVESTGTNSGVWEVTGFTGTLSSITIGAQNGANNGISRVIVDGYVLLNGAEDNSFYLPLDGNSPIGEDKSGKRNDFTPKNFGGSNTIEKATGAFPILNTGNGGTVARPGVFGSEVGYRETVSSSSGGGNPYIFDTRGTQPTLSFIRGATYIFDYSSATSHPLRFATAADAAGSTEYTDGTSVSGNVISFTVPHNAPDTLYYYCTNHGGMGNSISVTTDETKADPYAWKCVLAVPFVGSANDVSAAINCTTSNHTATVSGSVASSAQSNFYNGSFFFDGTDDNVSYAHSEDFHIGASDFTIEGWVWKDNKGSRQSWIGQRDGGSTEWRILFDYTVPDADSEGTVRMEWGSQQLVFAVGVLKHSRWNHVAMVRSGTTGTLYINGISVATQTLNDIGDYAADLYIGQQIVGGGENYQGYMNDIRIYKGVAKYTSSAIGEQVFIPASTNPDILPDTPSGVATKTQLTKITDGAVSVGTRGIDNLEVAESADFGFGTGDWTVEGYFYVRESGSNRVLWDLRNGSSTYYFLRLSGASAYVFQYGGGTTTFSAPDDRWNHIAVSRSSGTTKIFVNGKQTNSFSDSTDASTGTLRISSFKDTTTSSSDYGFGGHLSNFRIVKGTALYTSDFTVPTAPLTNVTNTKLLCCQSNSSAGRAAVSPNISGINNGKVWSDGVTIPTSSVTGSASNLFDGDLTTSVQTTNSSEWVEVNLGSVSFSTSFELYGSSSYNQDYEFDHAGGTYTFSGNFGGDSWVDFAANLTSPVTAFRFKDSGGTGSASILAVRVDNTILLDPIAPRGNAAATNFNPFTTDINTVRGQESGYCTWNPLVGTGTLSDGNLKFSGSNAWKNTDGTISFSSGKWYYEGTYVGSQYGSAQGNIAAGIGFKKTTAFLPEGSNAEPVNSADYRNNTIAFYQNGYFTDFGTGTGTHTSIRSQIAAGDVVGISIDLDNGSYEFYVNGISITSGTVSYNGELVPWTEAYYVNNFVCNFGQKPFKFPPPEGFQPLTSSTVRPDTVIARPDQYVSVMTYSGTNNSGDINVTSTDTNFTPNFVWVKTRTGGNEHHAAYDSVRGANKRILPSSAVAEVTTTANDLNAFIPGGFTMNGQNGHIYNNGYTHVAWMWKAGGSGSQSFYKDDVGYATAAAAGITDGTAALTGASVGTKQGFSIVKWTTTGNGQSFSHALSTAPDFIISKSLNGAHSWRVFHKDLTAGQNLLLDGNGGESSYDDDLASVTSTVVNVAGGGPGSTLGPNIAYCWHDVPGLQKFGTYEGGNNAFVELGFRPAVVIFKNMDGSENWNIFDGKRSPYNSMTASLQPNLNTVEYTSEPGMDFLSNGFKCRGSVNTSATYIYAAWAEAPSFNLYGASANAR